MIESLPIAGWRCYRLEFMCWQTECRYWIRDFEMGNCVLRCERVYMQREVAERLDMSYQMVQHIEGSGMEKMKKGLMENGVVASIVNDGYEQEECEDVEE